MKGIFFVPMGNVDTDVLKSITNALEKTFHIKVEFGQEMAIPQESYNLKRRQYHSSTILKKIQGIKPKNLDLMIGVIDEDLYVPDLNFVFGEADVSAGIAIISLTRLRQEFYGFHPDTRLFQERAIKEAIHEIGHLFGLDHCPDPKCIMHFSNSIVDTDRKGPGFCNICKNILGV